MHAISEFSLETPAGPKEAWPLKLPVLRNGLPTSLLLPGHDLRYQFRDEEVLLFITDYDCPYEEITEFTLCDTNLVCRGRCSIGGPLTSHGMKQVEWIDRRKMRAVFPEDDTWLLTIRDWHIPGLLPRMKLKRFDPPVLH